MVTILSVEEGPVVSLPVYSGSNIVGYKQYNSTKVEFESWCRCVRDEEGANAVNHVAC